MLTVSLLLLATAVSANINVNLTVANSAVINITDLIYFETYEVSVGAGMAAELRFDPPIQQSRFTFAVLGGNSESVSVRETFWVGAGSTNIKYTPPMKPQTFVTTLSVVSRAPINSVTAQVNAGQSVSVTLPAQQGASWIYGLADSDAVQLTASCTGSANLTVFPSFTAFTLRSSAQVVSCGASKPLSAALGAYANYYAMLQGAGAVSVSAAIVEGTPLPLPATPLPSNPTRHVTATKPAFFYIPAGKWASLHYPYDDYAAVVSGARYALDGPFSEPSSWPSWPRSGSPSSFGFPMRYTIVGSMYIGWMSTASKPSYTLSAKFGEGNAPASLDNSPFLFGNNSGTIALDCKGVGIALFTPFTTKAAFQYTVEAGGKTYTGGQSMEGGDPGILLTADEVGDGPVVMHAVPFTNVLAAPVYRTVAAGYPGIKGELPYGQSVAFPMSMGTAKHVILEGDNGPSSQMIIGCSGGSWPADSPLSAVWQFFVDGEKTSVPGSPKTIYCAISCSPSTVSAPSSCAYQLYSADQPHKSPKKPGPNIVLAVVLPIVAVVLIAAAAFLYVRRRREKSGGAEPLLETA